MAILTVENLGHSFGDRTLFKDVSFRLVEGDHIGLGRKMKQSHLQNAVMEFLLHEPIRKRALERQQKIGFDINENILSDLFIELAHQRYNISSLLK